MLSIFLLLIVNFVLLVHCDGGNVTEGPDESYSLRKLRADLLTARQYDRMSRPVKNHLTTTKVDMKITINEFVDLNTASSYLVTDAWFHISWKDEFLVWDPNEYQQLKQIHLGASEIWKPDIVLINSAQQYNILNVFAESEIVVNSTGEVLWITMGMLYSKCPVWAYDYPFTVKPLTCRLTFCSLIYQSHEVNITTPGNEFFLAGPWFVNPRLQLSNITGERYERSYESYGSYSFVSLNVQLKRLGNALPLLVKVPTLVSILMVLCMFFIPVTWAVRIQLAIFAVFIQLLLILYIGFQLGPNAIGLARPISYLRSDLFLSCAALVLTLVFRRLLALADILPALPYIATSLLAGPFARLLCFGINQNEYIAAQDVQGASRRQSSTRPFSAASSGGYKSHRSLSKRVSSILPTSLASNSNDHVTLVDEESADNDFGQNTSGNSNGGASSNGLGSGNLAADDWQPSAATISGGVLPQLIVLSNSQFEWMQLIVFCDRVLFALYTIIMVPRLM